MTLMTIKEFCQYEYASDPARIMFAARHEIADIANQAGVDWYANESSVLLPRAEGVETRFKNYTGRYPKTTERRLWTKCDLYSNVRTSSDGIDYPQINFVRKGSGRDLVFCGKEYIRRKYAEYISRNGGAESALSQEEIRKSEIRKKLREEEFAERERNREKSAKRTGKRRSARTSLPGGIWMRCTPPMITACLSRKNIAT